MRNFCFAVLLLGISSCANTITTEREARSDLKPLERLSLLEDKCRNIILNNYSDEGACDYEIRMIVEQLIEDERWGILVKILDMHFCYPQSTSNVLDILSDDDTLRPDITQIHKMEVQYDRALKLLAKKLILERRNREKSSTE